MRQVICDKCGKKIENGKAFYSVYYQTFDPEGSTGPLITLINDSCFECIERIKQPEPIIKQYKPLP